MACDNSSSSSHARDDAQGIEVLGLSLLTQEISLRALADSVDCRFQAFEGCFDEIMDRLDALAFGANRGRNEDRKRLRDDVSQDQLVNRPELVHHHRQSIYSDDLDVEDFLFTNHRLTRGGGRHGYDYERDSGDFKLKVDIPFFISNLNREDFIDWIAYMTSSLTIWRF